MENRKDEIWTRFIKFNGHLSIADLDEIKRHLDIFYDLGYIDGLERGQEALASTQATIMDLFK